MYKILSYILYFYYHEKIANNITTCDNLTVEVGKYFSDTPNLKQYS